jgi:RecB family endonuclease NucS
MRRNSLELSSRSGSFNRHSSAPIGGRIDLLCINGDGDIVIVELKRDKTPREITAQALDYASWVQGGKMRMK